MTERSYPLNALISVLPVDELLKNDKNVECFSASINVTEDKESEFQKYLEDYTKQVDPNTDFDSKEGLRDDFSSFTDTIRIVGGFLSFIIAVIGILNFINNMFTSVVTRRQEFAILQSIGLTSGQFKKLLIYEGLYYTAFTAVISLLIGSLLSVSVIRAVNHVTAYFVYHFTVTPLIAVMPVFIIISCAIPVLAYHNVRKQSIIERLRETE
jgi:putative ABC transport system permease protein